MAIGAQCCKNLKTFIDLARQDRHEKFGGEFIPKRESSSCWDVENFFFLDGLQSEVYLDSGIK
jgi:hypothetical protein